MQHTNILSFDADYGGVAWEEYTRAYRVVESSDMIERPPWFKGVHEGGKGAAPSGEVGSPSPNPQQLKIVGGGKDPLQTLDHMDGPPQVRPEQETFENLHTILEGIERDGRAASWRAEAIEERALGLRRAEVCGWFVEDLLKQLQAPDETNPELMLAVYEEAWRRNAEDLRRLYGNGSTNMPGGQEESVDFNDRIMAAYVSVLSNAPADFCANVDTRELPTMILQVRGYTPP